MAEKTFTATSHEFQTDTLTSMMLALLFHNALCNPGENPNRLKSLLLRTTYTENALKKM